MYRDTIFTIVVYPEMYRDTIFTIDIYPDMYHDTVSFVVSSRLCFCGCTHTSLVLFGLSNTRVSPDGSYQDSLSKVLSCRNESIGRHLVSRVVQRTLGKYAAVPDGVDQVGNLTLSLVADSRGVYLELSRGVKLNEFADLTTSEFVSEYTEYESNIVWSGRKHLGTHEYFDKPLDQVTPGNCFQSSDEGPSLFFVVVDLSQSWTVCNLVCLILSGYFIWIFFNTTWLNQILF